MPIIEDQLRMDPYSNSLFLFCGKRRDRIKAILHDLTGWCFFTSVLPLKVIMSGQKQNRGQRPHLASVRLADVRS
ncbi:MAG: transposase [bacterium LCO1.1]|uniref:Transposase n=1 Tax=Candidatus Weimeria bifida TaxID=2599074 RepID=A0A6N7J071_9FIRM|nr:transposase [Candidatus Weimeria bifida]